MGVCLHIAYEFYLRIFLIVLKMHSNSKMLEKARRRNKNRSIEAAQVIEKHIDLAKIGEA
ncbi:MAG: hypothetical protein A4E23_01637 [Methanomethylovorans sp. PtaU1.Bin073]|nr:MAG: hypothetical protein A4E23_01637 [Methanomethylovorans sp. PtaU1.Bin073]